MHPTPFFAFLSFRLFHSKLYFSANSNGPKGFFTDLDRKKEELSNEYKIIEIKVATRLHLSHTRCCTTTLIIVSFIIPQYFICPWQL